MENITSSSSIIWNNPAVFGFRVLFYALTPGESSFEKINQVPNYVAIVTPYFVLSMVVEILVHNLRGDKHKLTRWNDAMSSIAQGFFSRLPDILMRNIELTAYLYVYENYRITELPWDSPWTWWIAMLGVDLGYYWVHRMAHEINFMWAAHQVHHSSEDYNLSTALRQSALQRYNSWIFYLPIALFVPPQVFLVHVQLNLLYQFWIHTELVHKLGPLEWILNTPSHHRVHHGRNRYCIDKNYAGVLIIWDRMFGTFVAEDEDDTIAYGLVHTVDSWDTLYIQLCHWKYMLKTAWNIPGLGNKMSVFLKGPGWVPGKGRLGEITDIPDIHGVQEKYDKKLPFWLNLYTWLHFAVVLVARTIADEYKQNLTAVGGLLLVLYFLWTVTNIGYIYEHKPYAAYLELLRCVVTLCMDSYFCGAMQCSAYLSAIRALYGASAALWLLKSGRQLGQSTAKPQKQD